MKKISFFCADKTKCLTLIIMLISLVFAGIGAFQYFYKDILSSSATNVLKIKNTEKIESGMINSDFYYRVAKYSQGKVIAEYSELVPVVATMEYDISHLSDQNRTIPEVKLKTVIDRKSSIYLLNDRSDLLTKEAKNLKKFSESYAEIIATQDPDYIKNSDNQVLEILKNIFGTSFNVQSTNIVDYYKNIKIPLVPNLRIHYYKKNNTFNVVDSVSNEWKPNIIEWRNSNGDKINLQLLFNKSKLTIGKMIKYITLNFTGDFIRVSNYNKEYESTLYFTYKKGENKIKGYYLDESSGGFYLLTLHTTHVNRSLKNLNNYLKVAMGISFVPSSQKNKFSIMQQNIESKKEFFCTDNFLDKVENYNDIYDELNEYGLSGYYGFKKLKSQNICFEESNEKWLNFYREFKRNFGAYPSEKANIYFMNLFSRMNKLDKYFSQEKDNVREDIGIINSLIGMPYDYVEIKAATRVKNKYKKDRF